MDKNLLDLWQSFSSGHIKIKDLADFLSLSTKQTVRYLHKWMDEGWLIFNSGKGRGHTSSLQWLKNIEQIYESQVMEIMDQQPVEKSSKYLLYNWSPNSKLRLMTKFHSKFGYIHNSDDKLIIPRRKPFLTTHPLEAADVHSAHIVANVFNRLVYMDEKGNIFPEIAHSWDLTQSKLRLYLKKSIKFHDGSILTATDVKLCLSKLRSHKYYKDLWAPIEKIDIVSPLIIDIHYPDGCSYCLQMLCMINTSIYKENNGVIVGTGGFYIGENNQEKTSLIAFNDYFQERPLLDTVEFIQVPLEFDTIYQSSKRNENTSTFQVERNSGFGVIIMNAWRNSPIQRIDVRNYLHYIITKNINHIHEYDFNKIPNPTSCLKEIDHQIDMRQKSRPSFKEPLIIKATQYTEKLTKWLMNVLEKENIPFLVKWVPFESYLRDEKLNEQVDLFIHGEVFEMNQEISFYYFLTARYSPLAKIVKTNETIKKHLDRYKLTHFEKWPSLNKDLEKELIESSIMIPLYYDKCQIPFSSDLTNIRMKYFGYVDFSQLWVRPLI
ncbi:ABC transporter substrate-binding protein [Bacillus pseudomycoides]|uniref:ABC transporter substrate-binding protein n=1 Tax=Bacillus pseudomycoides TaxID=64104 RepID=UPI000BED27E2|nr:ABC transporter substrate-binding protein [Bacillus pseudomycoides]PDY00020.1 ABC transporter substrate-binding protein [Bacillus pseudomycoides]PEK73316.1 ABC transporter substrate-binding protein [Bacillus pseudomycoides]PEN04061.1 ABC transporter substrate-binding protein [Bacillus pseudomycoides]PGB84212.1 ABC transporter substrate-binding protein [Bacillus pseudomycoides]